MTTHIDHTRVDREVAEYYRYATFSHKWEDNEPLFESVVRIVVYERQVFHSRQTANVLQDRAGLWVPLGME